MPPPNNKKTENSDFDPDQLLAGHQQHEKTIVSLTERIAKIEGHLSTPQAVAAFFKESAKDSRVLEGVFAEMFCRFVNEHQDVQAAVKKKIEEVDRNFVQTMFKRFWVLIGSGIIFLAGSVFKEFVQWATSLFPHK
jgi:hypothetical protein